MTPCGSFIRLPLVQVLPPLTEYSTASGLHAGASAARAGPAATSGMPAAMPRAASPGM